MNFSRVRNDITSLDYIEKYIFKYLGTLNRLFPKIGNFAEIYICIFVILASMLHYKSYFHDVHIFADI